MNTVRPRRLFSSGSRAAPGISLARAVLTAFSLALLLAAGGCSTFERDYRAASQFPREPGDLQGPWQGTWKSDANGHTDRLRCIISKTDLHIYQARFKANYRKIFTFSYTVPLQVRPADEGVRFSGEADLGWLAGGTYRYEGSANATNFFSTYSCKYDHGTFRMGRLDATLKSENH